MSMLAEKKTKTKWILDPRQNEWTKDSNKFGQRMLEKMGWTPGKGLGASEQGITTALRIKYKSDYKGLGCKDTKFESLTQQKKFEKLLSELNSERNSPDPENKLSLEEKSKMTKKRVFYLKSIKGKDITRYSERDLQCIFGFDNKNKSNQNSCDLADNNYVHFQENTNLNLDYISKKKRKLDTENENSEAINTKMDSGIAEAEQVESQKVNSVQNGVKKKKKKNKCSKVLYDTCEVQFSEGTEAKSEVKCKQKLNKKSKKYLSVEYENNDMDGGVSGEEIENIEAEINAEINSIKKKNKFGHNKNGIQEQNEIPQEVNSEMSFDSERKKKKTKRKNCTDDFIDSQNGNCEEVENKQNIFKKKKKKNKECL